MNKLTAEGQIKPIMASTVENFSGLTDPSLPDHDIWIRCQERVSDGNS